MTDQLDLNVKPPRGYKAALAADERDRVATLARLKAVGPLRSSRPQEPIDGLALFDTGREPPLL